MKKFVKISLITFAVVTFIFGLSLTIFVASSMAKFSYLKLDESLFNSPTANVQIYDKTNRLINEENSQSIKFASLEELNTYTVQAFLSIEDKNFYEHNGLNYKRILKAVISNLKSHSLKEGASTISQQLIKNTHLSSEKTFERKIKEIVLTRKLENAYSKNQILEKYLNVIYYGNNCYGIENASNYYFSKSAKDLTLAESALLAGLIKSPSKYSPINREKECLNRRNLVLKEMEKDGFITEEDFERAKSEPVGLNLHYENANKLNSYSEAALTEACNILNMPAKSIAISKYKIHTYQDPEKQKNLSTALSSEDFQSADFAGIVVDAKKHAVTAYLGNSAYKILDAKRQPGSIIKPVLVYGPALNEDLISPLTQLDDEPLTLNGYEPKNVDGKYRGYVSAKEALAKSINIPAIKVLSYVGIEKAKAYAKELGFHFTDDDNSYALALGGMTYGENLLTLVSAYSVLPNLGKYSPAVFVEYITDSNGKILYRHKAEETQVFREDSSYLLTTMLEESVKNGTAKALNQLKLPLASKTGTVGRGKDNVDAYNITFSPSEVCGVWVGNLDNTPIKIAGGNEPTRCIKKYFENANSDEVFTMPESVVEREIDLLCLQEDHIVKLANTQTPKNYKETALFSRFNEPKEVSSNFENIPDENFEVFEDNKMINVEFTAKKQLIYHFYDGDKLLETIKFTSGNKSLSFKINEKLIVKYGFSEKDMKEKTFKFASIETSKKEEKISSSKRKWLV